MSIKQEVYMALFLQIMWPPLATTNEQLKSQIPPATPEAWFHEPLKAD